MLGFWAWGLKMGFWGLGVCSLHGFGFESNPETTNIFPWLAEENLLSYFLRPVFEEAGGGR